MKSVGIRELRQHASSHIAQVQAGASLVITDRGRPVARIVPFTELNDPDADLIAAGELLLADQEWVDVDVDSLPSGDLTAVLQELRADHDLL